jgi:predicted ATP-dependent serine protease
MAPVQPVSVLAELTRQQAKRAGTTRLMVGSEAIDRTLSGGFESGQISCISGDTGTGKTAVGVSAGTE